MSDRITEIKERLAAVPEGHWHSALGSGHMAMTAVFADPVNEEVPEKQTFICDVLPDYAINYPGIWALRNPLLDFITNAPEDIRYLLSLLEER